MQQSNITIENTGIILLAAGASQRMGKIKQLLPFKNESLIRNAINTILEAGFRKIITVLGAHAPLIHSEIQNLPITTIVNEDWEQGMGSSIGKGVSCILSSYEEISSVIIILCDQPFLSSDHLLKIFTLACENDKSIVATSYNGLGGVPALFRTTHFQELLNLKGKEGAKKIIRTQPENVILLTPLIKLIDIDTIDDFEKLQNFSK